MRGAKASNCLKDHVTACAQLMHAFHSERSDSLACAERRVSSCRRVNPAAARTSLNGRREWSSPPPSMPLREPLTKLTLEGLGVTLLYHGGCRFCTPQRYNFNLICNDQGEVLPYNPGTRDWWNPPSPRPLKHQVSRRVVCVSKDEDGRDSRRR